MYPVIGGRYRVIAYAYRTPASAAPYRAYWNWSTDRRPRRVLLRVARRTFGAGVTLAAGPVRSVTDRDGRDIYGPAGAEVIPGGTHHEVWDAGVIAGYVSTYPAPTT